MSKLTSSARKSLPKSDFALPGKRSASGGKGGYPIPDKNHARNALARVSEFGSSKQKAEVRAKVHAKYPGIGKSRMGGSAHNEVHGRGHHSNQGKGHMSHAQFQGLDHGGSADHMVGRKGKY